MADEHALALVEKRHEDKLSFVGLFALRSLYLYGTHTREDVITADLAGAISLTPGGEKAKEFIKGANLGVSDEEATFAVFLVLSHHEVLVDVDKTDCDAIRGFLNRVILDRSLVFPYLFEHKLYDRAPAVLEEDDDKLNLEKTSALLADTPMGVFQIHNFVVGPYGLLESAESRYFRPPRRVQLGHCKNLLCTHVHEVELSRGTSRLMQAWAAAKSQLIRLNGENAPFEEAAEEAIEKDYYYDDWWVADLPSFLGNAFSERELISIAAYLLEVDGRLLGRCPLLLEERKAGAKKSDIAGKLTKANSMQLILLASDGGVVSAIDRLIEQRTIVIPDSEIRFSPTRVTPTWQHVRCECSNLGFRVAALHSALAPLARLKRLVLSLYDKPENLDDLLFELRKMTGATAEEKLERLIATRDPSFILESFVFANRRALLKSLENLRASHLKLPDNDDEEKIFIQKILWKLGFPKTQFGSPLGAFHQKLRQFREVVGTNFDSEERWREQVRSVGVNLFVALEEVLDMSLAFSAWLFISDHVAEHLAFNLHRARQLTAAELSGVVKTDQGPVDYKESGKNTLFPLILMFGALRERLESLLKQPADKYRKPRSMMAFFSSSSLQMFPFKHYHFVFDVSEAELRRCLDLFESVNKRLQEAPVMRVRNNLGHAADLFPTRDEMERCYQALNETIGELERSGLVPTIYGSVAVEHDGFQRQKVISRNYANAEVTWFRSPSLTCLHELPEVNEPQVLIPSIKFPGTAEPVRFSVKEDSDFTRMWENYPRRRGKDDGGLKRGEAIAAPPPPVQ